MITETKWKQLKKRMDELDIFEEDIQDKFILASGSGGQKVQKSASCVYLMHKPTGIELKCQESRSQSDNRFYARRRLCDKVEFLLNQEKSKEQQKIEKIRRQKRRRSKRAKEKILEAKSQRSEIKKSRKPPTDST